VTRGCCNANLVAVIDALKKRQESELNPDVRRGLAIAIHTLSTTKEASE
jgi:hypothetical protein